MMFRVSFVMGCALMAGCATVQQTAGTDRIDQGYVTAGGEWSSGGGITAVARVVEREGRTALCGAWMADRQSTSSVSFNEDVMAAGSASIGGARLATGLGFMRRLAYRDSLAGETANCVLTSEPWRADYEAQTVDLQFPRIGFGNTSGLGRSTGLGRLSTVGGGDSVTFRQTPRPDAVS